MQIAELGPIPWTDCAFVSVAQAAQIVARSPDWVRTQVGEGKLAAARLAAGGPLVISVLSLQRLVATALPVRPRPERSRPRLVIVNS